MSGDTVRRIGGLAVEAATEAAWAQWAALGAAVTSGRAPASRSVVDPEALVLVSLAMAGHERRLWDVLHGWAHEGARLLSVQRVQGLSSHYPAEASGRVGDFARFAVEAGDRRWTRLARDAQAGSVAPRGKAFGTLHLMAGPALMLRLRAGLGVGSRADVLTYLLAERGAPRSVKAAVFATAYTDRAVRTSLEEMSRAGLLGERSGRPASYTADPRVWGPLLGLAGRGTPEGAAFAEVPSWRAWSTVYAFLLAVADWAHGAAQTEWSEYVVGSRARTLVEAHEASLRSAGFEVAIPARTPDAAWFIALVERFVAWTEAWL